MKNKENLAVSSLTILYALRYALKRVGPAHGIVRDDIYNNIKNIDSDTLELFIKEITTEISSGEFKDDKNKDIWGSFVRDLQYEVDIRKEVVEFYKEK